MKRKIGPEAITLMVALALFIIVIPRVLSGYSMSVMNVALMFAIVAYGISVMLGMGGQLTFAAVSFMGGGAYFIANVCTDRLGINMPTLPALLLTPIVFAGIAFVLGLLLLKLKETYFTFSTIALVQVTYAFYNNYKPLFGGADGISGIPTLNLFGYKFTSFNTWFYVLIAFVIIVALVIERIRKTQLGRSLAAIRDNETAALTLGVNVYMTKVIAFAIAGGLAAFGGALWCMHGRFVGSDMFNYNNAAQFIIMAMLGGVNNSVGIFVGAILVKVLPEILRSLQAYMQLIWGVLIILMMVFMPTGLAGLYEQISAKIKNNRTKKRMGKEQANESDIKA